MDMHCSGNYDGNAGTPCDRGATPAVLDHDTLSRCGAQIDCYASPQPTHIIFSFAAARISNIWKGALTFAVSHVSTPDMNSVIVIVQ
jgi:hypothetical protein